MRNAESVNPGPLKRKLALVANLEAELVRHIRSDPEMSRVRLARKMHLAPSTVGAYVDRLIAEGLLVEGPKAERELGRPPTMLSPNPRGGRFIGVDFEAQNIMATAVDFSQAPINQVHKKIRSSDSVEQILEKIERAIQELSGSGDGKVLGIGIGVPGTIDSESQVSVLYSHIRGWKNIPLAGRLSRKFRVPVYLENNIRTMALAELWFGLGKKLNNFVCIGIRTGIGSGIIIRQKLLRGKRNLAGEIEEWYCPNEWISGNRTGEERGNCEKLVPLEKVMSVPAILQAIGWDEKNHANGNGRGPFEQMARVAEKAKGGDRKIQSVLDRAGRALAWVCYHIDTLINPEKIILGGPLTALGDELLKPMRRANGEFISELRAEPAVLVHSTLGEYNGALGAAALAMYQWKPKR